MGRGRTGRFDCPVEAGARRVVQTDASTALGMTVGWTQIRGGWRLPRRPQGPSLLLLAMMWGGVLRGWLDDSAEKVFTGAFPWC